MKMLNKATNSYFQTYSHSLDVGSILEISPFLFRQVFNAFKKTILTLHAEREITLVRVLVKIVLSDITGKLEYKTLTRLLSFEVSEAGFLALETRLTKELGDKSGEADYNSLTPVSISFSYHREFDPSLKLNKQTTVIKSGSNKKALDRVIIKGRNVPISKNISHFGNIMKTSDNVFTVQKPKTQDDIYMITAHPDHNQVVFFHKGIEIFEFTDHFTVDSNDRTFTRVYKNKEIHYKNGKVLLAISVVPTRSFQPKKLATKLAVKKFFTLDIETVTVDSVLRPICVAIANKTGTRSYFITNHNNNESQMFLNALNSILKTSNNGAIVYVHNLSRFDGVFFINWLARLTDFRIKPKMKGDVLIEIEVAWINPNGKTIKIFFRDSYLLLPDSLRRLAIAFNVNLKGWFPFSFLNELGMDGLLYEGIVPDMTYYDNISELDYNNILGSYKNKAWNLRDAVKLHCENDCRVLWDIMDAFNKHMFELLSINIFKSPTLPTLSMNIYRSKFLLNHSVPVVTGAPYEFIRSSYRGGHTDVYKPQAGKCYLYDINSLFPTVMRNCGYPIGKMLHFRGNIFINNKYADAVGFIKCRITAPKNLHRPVLTTKINTNNGTRTVAPLGTWIDIITLEEYRAYKLLGYKFKIFEGYLFNTGYIFKEYVDFWYDIKKNAEPGSVMRFLAKLFLNSLYGRFGLSPYLPTNIILTCEQLEQLFKDQPNVVIQNVVDLEDSKTLLQLLEDSEESTANVNIAIAAYITANARIFMSKILANPAEYFGVPGLVIYYTDTDSIVTNMPLPDKFVGDGLGQFKLETVFQEAVFLAPKTYAGLVWNELLHNMYRGIVKKKRN